MVAYLAAKTLLETEPAKALKTVAYLAARTVVKMEPAKASKMVAYLADWTVVYLVGLRAPMILMARGMEHLRVKYLAV
jgi:hypothetical protein